MIRKILFAIAMLAGFAITATAQEYMYLIKGDKVVGKMDVNDVDYIAFELPQGVTEPKEVDVEVEHAGKNSITYKVSTLASNTQYVHMAVLESTLDYICQYINGEKLADVSDEVKEEVIREAFYSLAYLGEGTRTYTVTDNALDGDGMPFQVIAGQKYIVAVCDLGENQDLGENLSYTTVTTENPEESNATLSVEYTGLDDKGNAAFKFTMSDDIVRVHTMYGLKSVLDSYIALYGYDYTMFTFGQYWTPEELSDEETTWPVEDADDYVLYAVGIDAQGDWVKASDGAFITPIEREDGPKINIYTKEKGDGKVRVNFEISPNTVSEAYVRMLPENDVDNKLNEGYTLDEIATMGDATDITSEINQWGEYTYTNDNVPDKWMSILIYGKNDDGKNVMRINFHAYIDNSEWDISTTNDTPDYSKPALAMKGKSVAKSLKTKRTAFRTMK